LALRTTPTALGLSRFVSRTDFGGYTTAVAHCITLSTRPFADLGLRLTARCSGRTAGTRCATGRCGTTTAPAPAATGRMPSVGKTFEHTLDLIEVVLAKVQRVRLTVEAKRQVIGGADVSVLKVAGNNDLGDTGHLGSPFGCGRAPAHGTNSTEYFMIASNDNFATTVTAVRFPGKLSQPAHRQEL
jgi:hypothetical protein